MVPGSSLRPPQGRKVRLIGNFFTKAHEFLITKLCFSQREDGIIPPDLPATLQMGTEHLQRPESRLKKID